MLLPLILIPAAAALICLLVSDRRVYEYATICATAGMSVISFFIVGGALGGEIITVPGGIMYADAALGVHADDNNAALVRDGHILGLVHGERA